MAFIETEVNSSSFGTLTEEEELKGITTFQKKASEKKRLFSGFLKENPRVFKAFKNADRKGKRKIADNFNVALFEKFPDQFGRKKTIQVTELVESGAPSGLPLGPGRSGFVPREVSKEINLPILPENQEALLAAIERGQFKPSDALPDNKDLSKLSEKEQETFAELLNVISGMSQNHYIDDSVRQEWLAVGKNILEATGAPSELRTKTKALSGGTGFAKATIGTGFRLAASVEEALGKDPKESEEKLARAMKLFDPFSPLEKSVRAEDIDTFRTAGALTFAIGGSISGGTFIQGLKIGALKKLGLSATMEAAISLSVRETLPSFLADISGVDPDSVAAASLDALEGALFGTVAPLTFSKAARAGLKQNISEIINDFRFTSDPKDIAKNVDLIKNKLNLTQEEAQEAFDAAFPSGELDKLQDPMPRMIKAAQAQRKAKNLQLTLADKRPGPIRTQAEAEEAFAQPKTEAQKEAEAQVDASARALDERQEKLEQAVDTFIRQGQVDDAAKAQANLDELLSQKNLKTQAGLEQALKEPTEAQKTLQAQLDAREARLDEAVETFKDAPIISNKLAAQDINQAVDVAEDLVTPIDLHKSRARIKQGATIDPAAEKIARQDEIARAREASPESKVAEETAQEARAETLGEVFAKDIDPIQANHINRIETNKTLTRTQKDDLVRAATGETSKLTKKIDQIAEQIKNNPDAPQSARTRAELLKDDIMNVTPKATKLDKDLAIAAVKMANNEKALAKATKAEINEFLLEPVSPTQLKKTNKKDLMDRFIKERDETMKAENELIPAQAQKIDDIPEIRMRESDEITSGTKQTEYEPSTQTRSEHKAQSTDPENINNKDADPTDATAEERVQSRKDVEKDVTGEPSTTTTGDVPQNVLDANDRIVKRLSKQLADEGSGKSIGGPVSAGMFNDLVTVGAHLITRGFTNFAPWAKEMMRNFGNTIRGSLTDIWESGQRFVNKASNKIFNSTHANDLQQGLTKQADDLTKNSQKFADNPAVRAIDIILSPISTRIKRIAPRVFGRLQLFEVDTRRKTFERLTEVKGFVQGMADIRKTNRVAFRDIDRMFMNGKINDAIEVIKTIDLPPKVKSDLLEGITKTRKLLDDLFQEARDTGLDVDFRKDYMPRTVKDYKGLLKALGSEPKAAIDKLIKQEEKRLRRPIALHERAEVANRYLLRGGDLGQGRMGNLKGRTIEEVSEELSPFYGETHDNLMNYITQMTDRIEKQKLFGRHRPVPLVRKENVTFTTLADGSKVQVAKNSPTGLVEYDPETLGALVEKLAPGLKGEAKDELTSLIKSRFVEGEASMNEFLQAAKNVQYMAVLGKFNNALTQLGDLWGAIRRSPRDFMFGLKQASPFLGSDDAVKTIQLGLTRILEEHASSPLKTSKILNKLFKTTGLARIDQFGKEVFLNASLQKMRNIARGNRGAKALENFRNKHVEFFGEDFTNKLIDDLQSPNRSYETDAAIFNEVTEVQPITKLEMPEAYLNNPNGRMFYMLKTFTLKQMDALRREGVDELLDAMQETDKVEKAKKAAKAVLSMGAIALGGPLWEATTSDIMKDAIRGKEISVDSVSDAAFANFFRFFFMNKHVTQRFGEKKGALTAWAQGMIPPALSLGDQLIHDTNLALEGEWEFDTSQNVYSLPYVGDIVWWNSPQGEERKEILAKERRQSNDELFDGLDDVSKANRKEGKKRADEIELDLQLIKDAGSQTARFKIIQNIAVENPERVKQVISRLKQQRKTEILQLTENEQDFKKKPAFDRADQLAKVINNLQTPQEKQAMYIEMIRKGIITPKVKARLDPQLVGAQ